MNTNVFKIDFSNQISHIYIERERESSSTSWSSIGAEMLTAQGDKISNSNQIIHKNNVVNDLGMYKTKSNFYHWQKNKMPEAYCFEFFNNAQNTQTIPYKQPQ